MTCNHVVTAGTPLGTTLAHGSRREVSIVASDPAADLALLRVTGPPQTFAPVSDRAPAIGERLWAVSRFGTTAAKIKGVDTDPEVGHVLLFSTKGQGVGGAAAGRRG